MYTSTKNVYFMVENVSVLGTHQINRDSLWCVCVCVYYSSPDIVWLRTCVYTFTYGIYVCNVQESKSKSIKYYVKRKAISRQYSHHANSTSRPENLTQFASSRSFLLFSFFFLCCCYLLLVRAAAAATNTHHTLTCVQKDMRVVVILV